MATLIRRSIPQFFLFCFACACFVCGPSSRSFAQAQSQAADTAAAAKAEDSVDAGTMAKLIALRDDFVARIKAMGFAPRLAPPTILMDNPRSFGKYDDQTNTLHSGNWQTLPPAVQARFNQRARENGNGRTGEYVFEQNVHRWVFVHELGHWWRACQQQKTLRTAEEIGANRIAVAYWRERDLDFLLRVVERLGRDQASIPDPVPPGQTKDEFFNANYQDLVGTPAYTWYQAGMVLAIYPEKPALSFKQAIASAGN